MAVLKEKKGKALVDVGVCRPIAMTYSVVKLLERMIGDLKRGVGGCVKGEEWVAVSKEKSGWPS